MIVAFRVEKPENLAWAEILASLKAQGYTAAPRARRSGRARPAPAGPADRRAPGRRPPEAGVRAPYVFVVQDRLRVGGAKRGPRFLEAVEAALHFGRGQVQLFGAADYAAVRPLSPGACIPRGPGRTFRPASPALFSFNSPLGACPRCRASAA